MDNTYLLKMQHVSKHFGGVAALDDVQLELKRGEVHVVVGENGAGKSTLMKIILGIHRADSGSMEFDGKLGFFKNPSEALAAGISMIHQEISLVTTMTVSENVWLGRESLFMRGGFIDRKKREQMTRELFARLELNIDPNAVISTLSIAQLQLVELARAVSYRSKLIIMDEPTSALTNTEIEILMRIIRTLTKQGTAIVFISHKLDEVLEIADRISVYRDGHYIGSFDSCGMTEERLIHFIVGREIADIYPHEHCPGEKVVLELKDLCSTGVFSDISLQLHEGEVYGLSGLMGAGRSEVVRSIFGIDRHSGGEILIDGKAVRIRQPKDAVELGIAMVTEDRLRMGVIGALSILHNTTITKVRWLCSRLGFLKKRKEREEFRDSAERFSIKYGKTSDLIGSLSGGNQQKVILARGLMIHPKVLILDEPTRGIDIGSKAAIYQIIDDLAKQGLAILMVSSELPEIMGLCDRVAVLRHGRMVYEGAQGEYTQQSLISYAFGVGEGA